jgi:hypothetical protein
MELENMQRVAESDEDNIRCILTTDAEAVRPPRMTAVRPPSCGRTDDTTQLDNRGTCRLLNIRHV